MKNDSKNALLDNLTKLHTTKLSALRIKKNLNLDNIDVVEWCKERIKDKSTIIARNGKNWYASGEDCIITINASRYTIITAHHIDE